MQLILDPDEVEDLIEDWLLEQQEEDEEDQLPLPEAGLLEHLHYLVQQEQVKLHHAMAFLALYLLSPDGEISLPPHLHPLAQQLQLLEMDEGRMEVQ